MRPFKGQGSEKSRVKSKREVRTAASNSPTAATRGTADRHLGEAAPVASEWQEVAEVPAVVELALGIVSDPGICSGDPSIAGTRIGVHNVAALGGRYGWDLQRLHDEEFPHLSAEQFDAAVAWYRANEAEIEEILHRRQVSSERFLARMAARR
jgi:uncharacterized protein (DUF433 family)